MSENKCIDAYKQVLETMDSRGSQIAKIRALQPLIDNFISTHGLTYSMVISDLKNAGLDIKTKTLATYLFRIRNNNSDANNGSTKQKPITQTINPKKPSLGANQFVKGRPGKIENPSDLRKYRDMEIDLDGLRRKAEALKKAGKW